MCLSTVLLLALVKIVLIENTTECDVLPAMTKVELKLNQLKLMFGKLKCNRKIILKNVNKNKPTTGINYSCGFCSAVNCD